MSGEVVAWLYLAGAVIPMVVIGFWLAAGLGLLVWWCWQEPQRAFGIGAAVLILLAIVRVLMMVG